MKRKNGIIAQSIVRAVALTISLFSFLVWANVVLIQVTHPEYLPEPFSHLTYAPFNWRTDIVGMMAFAISAVSFLIYQLERNVKFS
ncbi:MAG TPA: hypothetical protein VEG61_02945 [Candidatus Dormibacteraeota bacterium]|nr:hypothetical protein [Candidatus Dormibacteraeota bacterium]